MGKRRISRGFTLIELMLALAIMALLLLIGMPSFTTFLRNSEIRSTAESMINGLRTSTAEAANRNTKVTFTLAGGGTGDWTITWVDDDGATQTIQQFLKKETGSSTKVTVLQGANTVVFNAMGRIENPGTDDHIRTIEIATLVVGEGRTLRIIVDDPNAADPTKPRGMRMCDPDPALLSLTPPDPRAC